MQNICNWEANKKYYKKTESLSVRDYSHVEPPFAAASLLGYVSIRLRSGL